MSDEPAEPPKPTRQRSKKEAPPKEQPTELLPSDLPPPPPVTRQVGFDDTPFSDLMEADFPYAPPYPPLPPRSKKVCFEGQCPMPMPSPVDYGPPITQGEVATALAVTFITGLVLGAAAAYVFSKPPARQHRLQHEQRTGGNRRQSLGNST